MKGIIAILIMGLFLTSCHSAWYLKHQNELCEKCPTNSIIEHDTVEKCIIDTFYKVTPPEVVEVDLMTLCADLIKNGGTTTYLTPKTVVTTKDGMSVVIVNGKVIFTCPADSLATIIKQQSIKITDLENTEKIVYKDKLVEVKHIPNIMWWLLLVAFALGAVITFKLTK